MIQVRDFTNGADVLAHAAEIRRKFFPPRPIVRAQVETRPEEPVSEEIVTEPTPKPDLVFPEDRQAWEEAAKADALQAKAQARQIVIDIAAAHDIPVFEIFGPSRRPFIVAARHEAIAAVYVAFPRWTLNTIGRFFGRDHTSVIHAVKKQGVWRQ